MVTLQKHGNAAWCKALWLQFYKSVFKGVTFQAQNRREMLSGRVYNCFVKQYLICWARGGTYGSPIRSFMFISIITDSVIIKLHFCYIVFVQDYKLNKLFTHINSLIARMYWSAQIVKLPYRCFLLFYVQLD